MQRSRSYPASVSEIALSPADAKALPLGWLLNPDKAQSFTDRILARLVQAEAHEPDVWLRDDLRQASITVALAAKGESEPFVQSSYICYGLHPERVWPAIVARRKALLGSDYSPWYETVPKKPVSSVRERKDRNAAL